MKKKIIAKYWRKKKFPPCPAGTVLRKKLSFKKRGGVGGDYYFLGGNIYPCKTCVKKLNYPWSSQGTRECRIMYSSVAPSFLTVQIRHCFFFFFCIVTPVKYRVLRNMYKKVKTEKKKKSISGYRSATQTRGLKRIIKSLFFLATFNYSYY